MKNSDNLIELTVTEAVVAMQRGELLAETYADALLARAKQCADLNAFRTLAPDRVLEAARTADKRRSAGDTPGPMHGLPIPVKDSVNTADYPTSNGTRALRDFHPRTDADVLKPLKAAGAIVMGKTNLHELSFGWTSNNECFGSVHNPHDRARIPGGSSGGSAAAVAARIAPLAIAEDTLGSIRVPASCCGLAGLRPTFGRYPDRGIMSLTADKFDQVGPVARSVADLILFDSVVAGDDAPATPTPLQGVRIGLADHFLAGLEPAVERVVTSALAKLREAGANLIELKMPELIRSAPEIAFTIIASEAAACVENFLREQDTGLTLETMLAQAGPSIRALMAAMAGSTTRPPRDIYEAMLKKREQLKIALRDWYRETNIFALAHPVILTPPTKIGQESEVELGGKKVPIRAAFGRNIALGSCASMASLVLPAGMTPDGLPIGLEFDALGGGDRALLSLGLSLEVVLGKGKAPGM
jgi:mandelamide amidase